MTTASIAASNDRQALSMPGRPIGGAAAWRGVAMRHSDAWIHCLSAAECGEIDAAIAAFKASGKALASMTATDFPLAGLAKTLQRLRADILEGRGFVLIRGLPIACYAREEVAIAYMGIGAQLGRFRSQNAKGHLLGHVKDLGLSIADPSVRYYQTNRRLEFHTDSVDVVGLLCLQTAMSGGASAIVSSMALHDIMLERRPDLLAALFEPFPTDRRGEVPAGMKPWFDIPVFNWYRGHLSAIYARQYITSAQRLFPEAKRLSDAQLQALEMMDELCNDPDIHLKMTFERGDIQFLHNHQMLHSRDDFTNWPEPERHRHLLRLWLAPREARPLPPVFALRYGSLEPGDRGGIVVPGTQIHAPLEPA